MSALPVTLEAVELHRIGMPLVRPFETSFGRQTAREVLLVRVRTAEGEGWGECVAMTDPFYSHEYVDGCEAVITSYLAPALLAARTLRADDVAGLLRFVVGHRMAKAALETAVLDAQTRAAGLSFGEFFGAVRPEVDCGVSVGISPSIDELLEEVAGYRDAGYRRIKLKIKPGWDLEPVAAVRELLGPAALLQVDANTAYTEADIDHLRGLDPFGLLLIEQPFVEEDIRTHVRLARAIDTPVCLDESITGVDVAIDAIERDATSIVNIKPGRVGGYLEAIRIHDACLERDVPVWCGGMLETGVGRAANVALAALPGFTLPGDTSASDRYFAEDLTESFVLVDGRLAVPAGPGSGVTVREELLGDWALRTPVVLSVS
ncbi:o-succinylbenzoate synthase [Herbiconiux sp. CPCC 203407]|uniref:o-succinylbenzoate synthase n=1 Tax=Herbiconiux oxytropis TaxID=2970915 RepID=A0AA42BUE3_9MICO|nr:o-succinylbenzoate synthase [Herbiconiux oxytropis]MCS5723974.1 o-succinylbenzoate synthase [Herbiconiux oxytropis]MCS5726817.1 o-succinylbenzoate synthase [Herbiconiux oxytropis]